jgi:hypothetical protein
LNSLLVLNVAIGAFLLVAVVAAAARGRGRPHSPSARLAAWGLVVVPLPLAVTLHLLLRLPVAVDEAAFATGALAFAAGAFLVLGRDDADSDGPQKDDVDPPWWPDFEQGFRRYSTQRSPRPDGLVRS